ncbi:tRNA (guanosine(37)-N1)-methyltransferase TrmD [Patescibacteria group bacterium]|nr:tRNA (guanosine(37)-N1)-methyltransferase TrmD [Patescibacteria group bacterium]
MQFDIITIFPHIFGHYFQTSILKKAQEKKLISINIHDLRDWATDKHKTVDDTPYGGGPGMILKVGPIYRALKFLDSKSIKKEKVLLLSPQGKKFDQKMAKDLSNYERIVLVCGRYEGVDARVDKLVDEKISIGDYVLTGGELPAMVMVDSITRLVPKVINEDSLKEESFSLSKNCLEYPQYTRPEVFTYKSKSAKLKKLKVPKVLLSGNHQEIAKWKQERFNKLTR